MIRLKKKQEETKAAAEAESAMAIATEPAVSMGGGGASAPVEEISIDGIGGKKVVKAGGAVGGGKKRTPGELRIQKGNWMYILLSLFLLLLTRFQTKKN